MDRQGFLSSMPFLLPCPSAAWPPRCSTTVSSGNNNNRSTRTETILPAPSQDFSSTAFKLSLEPAIATSTGVRGQQQILEQIQPAFFGLPLDGNSRNDITRNQQSSFDPSIADIQVAVESSCVSGSSVINNNNDNDSNNSQDDRTNSALKGRVLFVAGGNHHGGVGDSSSTQTSSSKVSPDQQIQHQQGHLSRPLFMYFRIDKEIVYQVDCKQLLHVEVVVQQQQLDNLSGEKKKEAAGRGGSFSNNNMPPCLLLVFPCCIFRLFPLDCPSPSKVDTPDSQWQDRALEALRKLERSCNLLFTTTTTSPTGPSVPTTAAWSPSGSSSLPSSAVMGGGEAGQKDGGGGGGGQSHSHSTLSSHSYQNNNKKLRLSAAAEQDDDPSNKNCHANHIKRKAKRRRDALDRSRKGLQCVETVLGMPASVCKPDDLLPMKNRSRQHNYNNLDTQAAVPLTDSAEMLMPKTQAGYHAGRGGNNRNYDRPSHNNNNMSIGPLLTGTVDDLSNAYGSNAETEEVLQLYEKEIEEQRCNEMDKLLDSFFPTQKASSRKKKMMKNKKKNRRGSNREDNHHESRTTTTTRGTKSAEEVMKEVRRLMQRERALVEERSLFLQLPTRG